MNEVASSFGLSQRRLFRITGWNRSSVQYYPLERNDGPLRDRMRHWAERKPRWGLPILHDILKSEGVVINRKRTARIYREEGLSMGGWIVQFSSGSPSTADDSYGDCSP